MSAESKQKAKDLFRLGRTKGYVTLDEIIYRSPPDQSTEEVDDLLTDLAEDGIDVVGTAEVHIETTPVPVLEPQRWEVADPVTMYMRQLKSVPLLTREAEVETAQRLETARADLLEAAMGTNVAVDEMIQLGQRVKAGKVSLRDVIGPDPLGNDGSEADPESDEARKRFLDLVARLQRFDRKSRRLKDQLETDEEQSDEQRQRLQDEITRLRDKMLETVSQLDVREVYLDAVVRQVKELVQRLEVARGEIRSIEKQAKMSVPQLRKLLRERRKSPGPPRALGTVLTNELPLMSLQTTETPLREDISDEELSECVRVLRNAQRRIRSVERKANVNAKQLIKAHRGILQAERRAQRAKDELVLANQRLVVHIASKYVNRGLPFLELVQEGNLGLMRAVEKFEWRRGYKFSTYGTWWIRHAVSRAIANQTRTIRLPVHVRDAIRRLVKESQRHVLEVGREPTTEELAQRVGMSLQRVTDIMEASRKTLRWELPVGEDGETELGTLIADEQIPSPFDEVSHRNQWEQIARAMHQLGDRERAVLARRFGLDGRTVQTLEEVGKDLGITRERVRQIQARALRKLQLVVRSHQRTGS